MMSRNQQAKTSQAQHNQPGERVKDTDLMNELKVERYKYILTQIHTLNENVHKYQTLFQTLGTAIIGAGIFLFVSRSDLDVTPETTIVAMYGLLGLLGILAAYILLSIVGGIASWRTYRKEETMLLNEIFGSDYRKSPTFRNFLRWYETYVIFFVVLTVVAICWFTFTQIIPEIK